MSEEEEEEEKVVLIPWIRAHLIAVRDNVPEISAAAPPLSAWTTQEVVSDVQLYLVFG